MSVEPLNPMLYRLLQRAYGEVDIVSPGVALNWRQVREVNTRTGNVESRRKRAVSGEEYRVRCKICNDHRARLHFNHMWGVPDPVTGELNLWLAQCFNEHCMSNLSNQELVYNAVYYSLGSRQQTPTIRPGRVETGEVSEAKPPGPMFRLDRLVKSHPEHPAVCYLQDRFLDCTKLGKKWGVSYCPVSHYRLASNRIIIPIYHERMMVGWQARYIGDNVNGVPFNEAGVPKYWSNPDFPRRLVAYNMDRAVKHSTVVIVEGPSDVWSVGPQAIGLFGKTMSQQLIKRLAKGMRKHESAVIVVMLDPNWDKEAKRQGKPHHIKALSNELQQVFLGRVIEVWLPKDTDPGSTDRDVLRTYIREAASKRNLKVSFEKP